MDKWLQSEMGDGIFQRNRKLDFFFFLPMLGYLSFIWFSSSRSDSFPELQSVVGSYPLHIAGFGLLAFLAGVGLTRFFSRPYTFHLALLTAVFCLLVGAGDEFHQSFVPGRTCDLKDFLADLTGSVSVTLFMLAGLAHKIRSWALNQTS